MRVSAVLGALGGALMMTAAHAAPLASDRSIFTTSAIVGEGARENDGSLWFTTWFNEGARFVLPANDPGSSARLWDLLVKSNKDTRSLLIGFDVARARFNAESSSIDFPICSVQMDDMLFVSPRPCRHEALPGKLAPVTTIALAWAQVNQGMRVDSRPFLDGALADAELPLPLKIMALRTRAYVGERIAREEEPRSSASDRALIGAVADLQKLETLEPRNVEHRFAEAADRYQLGDYDAAEAVYDGILKSWPDETYRITVRRAALARLKGEYQRSLDLLNSLVDDSSGDLGMKFYYHRGWTLMKLGRFKEAIADLTHGIESEPQYAWAYVLRGCSYASVGQRDHAAGDFDEASALLRALPSARHSARLQQDIDLADSSAELLKRGGSDEAKAAGRVCDRVWDSFDKLRPRSPLLGTQAAQSTGADQTATTTTDTDQKADKTAKKKPH